MKYINHNFTDNGVKVEFDSNGTDIRFFTPDTPITELPEQVQDEATELWTQQYIEDWKESQKPSIEQWRNTFSIELYKLKIALENRGDLTAIETIIAGQPKQVQLAWANTPRVRRDSPTVASLAIAMEYTPETLDQIFKEAEQVQL